MWILWMTSLSSHSTSASVSELSRLVTHTAVSSPKCNSEKRPLSNSVAFQTLFIWHRYCGILKIHIVRKINTGIRYEPVYRPALSLSQFFFWVQSGLCLPSRVRVQLSNNGRVRVGSASGPRRVRVVHLRHFSGLHGFGSHFQIKYGSGSVPCSIFTGLFGLGYEFWDPWRPLVQSSHTCEINWTLGVNRAQARIRSPSVNTS